MLSFYNIFQNNARILLLNVIYYNITVRYFKTIHIKTNDNYYISNGLLNTKATLKF